MAASGFAAKGNFRKILSDRAKKSKYQSVVTTPEEMLEQEKMKAMMMTEVTLAQDNEDSDGDIDITNVKKSYTVDDITSGMNKQMKISKKKGGNASADVDMGPKKVI